LTLGGWEGRYFSKGEAAMGVLARLILGRCYGHPDIVIDPGAKNGVLGQIYGYPSLGPFRDHPDELRG
jgi:hypothetical protein